MLSFVCVFYTHTTTLGVLQLLCLMLTQGKKHCPSLPCVPWFPGLLQFQCLHGSRAAPCSPACCMLSVQLVTWDAAALSSYLSRLITVRLSPALQRPEKTPARSDNTSECSSPWWSVLFLAVCTPGLHLCLPKPYSIYTAIQ